MTAGTCLFMVPPSITILRELVKMKCEYTKEEVQAMVARAVAEERERAAKIVESYVNAPLKGRAAVIAAEIRRGEQ